MAEMSAEYITLCREAKLRREWERGDWFLDWKDCPMLPRAAVDGMPKNYWASRCIWMPTTDQLLDLLEVEGWDVVNIGHVGDGEVYTGYVVKGMNVELGAQAVGDGPDRKTALLRLLLAVRADD